MTDLIFFFLRSVNNYFSERNVQNFEIRTYFFFHFLQYLITLHLTVTTVISHTVI